MEKREFTFTKRHFIKTVAELSSYVDSLEDSKQYVLSIKEQKKKRSLTANRYCWELCTQIAEELSKDKGTIKTKDDVYRDQIKLVGVYRQVEISENAVDTLIHSWSLHGTGWICEKVDYTQHDGFVLVNLYYGSSTYNTKQMSRLIDNIVQDCKALGIETMTERELSLLKAEWR